MFICLLCPFFPALKTASCVENLLHHYLAVFWRGTRKKTVFVHESVIAHTGTRLDQCYYSLYVLGNYKSQLISRLRTIASLKERPWCAEQSGVLSSCGDVNKRAPAKQY